MRDVDIQSKAESYQYRGESGSRLTDELYRREDLSICGRQTGDNGLSSYGFPQIDISGFDQEKPYKSSGLLDDLKHGLKGIFSKDESVGDQLRRTVEGQMTPREREQYEKESAAIKKYQDEEWRDAAFKITIESSCPGKRPDTPMHDAMQKRVAAAQKQIESEVVSGMSPQERREFSEQMDKYKRQVKDSQTIKDPLGTGEGFRPAPKPGPAVVDYYKRIAAATERYSASK